MIRIAFDESLELGDAQVDQQHRELVALYNETCDALSDKDEPCHFVQILNHLNQFALAHCLAEEALMEKAGFPGLERHREQHNRSVARVLDFDGAALLEEPDKALELVGLIRGWLLSHIEDDRQLVSWLRQARHG